MTRPKRKPLPVIAPDARQWIEGNMFKGHGRLRCLACGEPLRDHKLTEPCPQMNVRAGELTTRKRQSAAEIEALNELEDRHE